MREKHRRLLAGTLLGLLLCTLAGPLSADRVIPDDGRVIKPRKARPKDGGYLLEFEMGEIFVADPARLKAVEIEGDMSEYVPQNEDERQKLAQGFGDVGGTAHRQHVHGLAQAVVRAAPRLRHAQHPGARGENRLPPSPGLRIGSV